MIVQMENTQITAHHILTFEVLSNHELLAIDQSLCYVYEWVSDTQQIKTCFQVLISSFLDLPNFHFFYISSFLDWP